MEKIQTLHGTLTLTDSVDPILARERAENIAENSRGQTFDA